MFSKLLQATVLVFVALLGRPTPAALAGEVFVNGVKIYQLNNVTLEGCTVAFDAQGNVRVSAPGYEIRVQDPPPVAHAPARTYGAPAAPGYPTPQPAYAPAAPPAYAPAGTYGAPAAPPPAQPAARPQPVGRTAFAFTTWGEQTITLPLVFQLSINGKVVRDFKATDDKLVLDLTPYLQKGQNTVRLSVEYDSLYGGMQPTAADLFAVRIQFGRFNGAAFTPERTLVEFKRNGTQMLGTIKEFQMAL
jgi:hypothetical protein